MVQKIKNFILVSVLAIASMATPVMMASTHADELFSGATGQATCGANLQDGGAGGCTDTTKSAEKVNSTLKAVVNILSFIVGVICVIMIIIAGLRFVTSGGDGSSTAGARNTIIYAVVGLIVVLMAQVIVNFVLGRAS
jgi:cytochrome bd-type quinol oxidase subunit 2